jgi:hypothetical protein
MEEKQDDRSSDNPESQNNSSVKNLISDASRPSPEIQPQTTSKTPAVSSPTTFLKINKSILIGLGILVITAIIGGIYLFFQNQKQETKIEEKSSTQ